MQSYQLVFDAVQTGYISWHGAILPLVLAVLFAALSILAFRWPAQGERNARLYPYLAGIMAIAAAGFAIVILAKTRAEYSRLGFALLHNQYHLVEGVVTDFVPEGRDGHPIEQFRVAGAHFKYSSSDMTSSFHWTAGKGGPIRLGLMVRIAAVDGKIARLEIVTPSK